jgi:hypothetical protein
MEQHWRKGSSDSMGRPHNSRGVLMRKIAALHAQIDLLGPLRIAQTAQVTAKRCELKREIAALTKQLTAS